MYILNDELDYVRGLGIDYSHYVSQERAATLADVCASAIRNGVAEIILVPSGTADIADHVFRVVAIKMEELLGGRQEWIAVVMIEYGPEPSKYHPLALDLADYLEEDDYFSPVYRSFDAMRTFAYSAEDAPDPPSDS